MYKEIPVSAVIKGHINMDLPEPTEIYHEYSFFEFRTTIERKTDLFIVILV